MGRGGGKGGGGRASGGNRGASKAPNPEAITSITPGRRNAAQTELINRVERHLNAQSPTARRTNKTLRDLQQKVSAARAVTGQAFQWASPAEKSLAETFFREGF